MPPPANALAIWLLAGTRKGCPYMAKHVRVNRPDGRVAWTTPHVARVSLPRPVPAEEVNEWLVPMTNRPFQRRLALVVLCVHIGTFGD